jgi:hypothetical protein
VFPLEEQDPRPARPGNFDADDVAIRVAADDLAGLIEH